jgi:hypothetical protein
MYISPSTTEHTSNIEEDEISMYSLPTLATCFGHIHMVFIRNLKYQTFCHHIIEMLTTIHCYSPLYNLFFKRIGSLSQYRWSFCRDLLALAYEGRQLLSESPDGVAARLTAGTAGSSWMLVP